MSEPWFEPNGILRYRPVTRQGGMVIAITWLTAIAFLVGGSFFAADDSVTWWVAGLIGFGAFVVGHAIVLWKMDWGYGRR